MILLQLVGKNHDTFWWVKDEVLEECMAEPDIEKRNARLKGSLIMKSIHSTEEVDVILVLDGVEDGASWEDLREWYEG